MNHPLSCISFEGLQRFCDILGKYGQIMQHQYSIMLILQLLNYCARMASKIAAKIKKIQKEKEKRSLLQRHAKWAAIWQNWHFHQKLIISAFFAIFIPIISQIHLKFAQFGLIDTFISIYTASWSFQADSSGGPLLHFCNFNLNSAISQINLKFAKFGLIDPFISTYK